MKIITLDRGRVWINKDARGEVNIVFLVDDPHGLSPEHEEEKDGNWTFFEELPAIEGHPAMARNGADGGERGNVDWKQPCDMAAYTSGSAPQTMKEGA